MSSIKHLITVADLDDYPDDDGNRYEVIEGELFVSTATGFPHQIALRNLTFALQHHLEQKPVGYLIPGPGAVFSNFDAVIPDLVFVRKERWAQITTDNRFIAAPNIVIEILSPGSENRKRDIRAKKRLYERYSVEEYWIVDPESRCLTIYRLKGTNLQEVAVLTENDEIGSVVLPDLRLKVTKIFKL
jgi:Uma2 family endonuclease